MNHKNEFVPADFLENTKKEPSKKLTQEDINCLECDFSCIQGCV